MSVKLLDCGTAIDVGDVASLVEARFVKEDSSTGLDDD